jgi:hypothetical protein
MEFMKLLKWEKFDNLMALENNDGEFKGSNRSENRNCSLWGNSLFEFENFFLKYSK